MSDDWRSGFIKREGERLMVKTWKATDPRPFHNETATLHVQLADGGSSWGDDREVMIGAQVQWDLHKPRVAWFPLTVAEARELSTHLALMADRAEDSRADAALKARLQSGEGA